MRIEGVEGDGQDHEARGFERESVELSIKRSKRIDGHIYIYISFGKRLGELLENQRDEDSSIRKSDKD